jgi:hypothetical protein
MGVGGQRHAPATLPPGDPVPIYRRLGGTQGQCGWMWKISPPPGFDPRTVQPVESHYTDWEKKECRGQLKCNGTRTETRFRLSAKRTSLFKSAGASVQSTTGSRAVRISGSNAGYTIFRGSVKGTGYPLHSPFPLYFPSRTSPCAITFQLDSKCL